MKTFFKITTVLFFSVAMFMLSAPLVGEAIAAGIGAASLLMPFTPMPTGILGMNSIAARMVFDNAKAAIQRAFPDKPGILNQVKLTQGSLRFAQAMTVGTTLYQFPILVNETQLGIFNTEKRLNQQDSFVISELGVFVSVPASGTSAAYRLQTYPNQVLFTAANANALKALYNGNLSLTINNDILIPNWDLMRHLVIPRTQQTDALGAASPDDNINGKEDGFYPVEPNVVLIGSKNNVLNIQLPVGLTAIAANSRIEIIVRGVLAQNSTVVS